MNVLGVVVIEWLEGSAVEELVYMPKDAGNIPRKRNNYRSNHLIYKVLGKDLLLQKREKKVRRLLTTTVTTFRKPNMIVQIVDTDLKYRLRLAEPQVAEL